MLNVKCCKKNLITYLVFTGTSCWFRVLFFIYSGDGCFPSLKVKNILNLIICRFIDWTLPHKVHTVYYKVLRNLVVCFFHSCKCSFQSPNTLKQIYGQICLCTWLNLLFSNMSVVGNKRVITATVVEKRNKLKHERTVHWTTRFKSSLEILSPLLLQ